LTATPSAAPSPLPRDRGCAGCGPAAGSAPTAFCAAASPPPGILLLAGGLLYTAGALSYRFRWPNPNPAVFGYHEVFHVYVCAAATCQFTAIALFIA
jgi:hemolysin III